LYRGAPRSGFSLLVRRMMADLAVDSGAATTLAGLPPPIGPKAAAMPPDHRLGLNHCDRIQNGGERSGQLEEDQPVNVMSHTRDPDLRLRTITCCRRTRISASSLARDFNGHRARAGAWLQAQTLRPPLAQLTRSVTRDDVFGSGRVGAGPKLLALDIFETSQLSLVPFRFRISCLNGRAAEDVALLITIHEVLHFLRVTADRASNTATRSALRSRE
jgi:hypothetical protein